MPGSTGIHEHGRRQGFFSEFLFMDSGFRRNDGGGRLAFAKGRA
jgi:hypothetical protein